MLEYITANSHLNHRPVLRDTCLPVYRHGSQILEQRNVVNFQWLIHFLWLISDNAKSNAAEKFTPMSLLDASDIEI